MNVWPINIAGLQIKFKQSCSREKLPDSRKKTTRVQPSTGAMMTPNTKDSLNRKFRPFKFLNLSAKVPKKL